MWGEEPDDYLWRISSWFCLGDVARREEAHDDSDLCATAVSPGARRWHGGHPRGGLRGRHPRRCVQRRGILQRPDRARQACRQAGPGGAPAQPAARASGTGTFWFNQPPQQEAFQKIIARFNDSGSGAKMEVVLVPANDVPAKLATAIAGGEPPDAVRLGGPAVNSLFITNGHAAAPG